MIQAELIFLEMQKDWYVFQSRATVSADVTLAVRASLGLELPNVCDLGAAAEHFIWTHLRKHQAEDYDYNKKLLVIDMGQYPYVTARIDDRDQTPEHTDQFSKDVYEAWSKPFDGQKIPTIVVNLNIPFTALKYVL